VGEVGEERLEYEYIIMSLNFLVCLKINLVRWKEIILKE
jgi:hypothetical protein